MNEAAELETTIDHRLRDLDPAMELIAVEQPAAESLRVYVDHPDGVDLGLCERVTRELRDLTERWTLEVSSPGSDRPLTKPEHFQRFVGRRVLVRTHDPIDGQRNFTGTITAAGEDRVSLDADTRAVEIPFAEIRRTNLVPELPGGGT
ncbi:MAG: ribosome maturation factor RimP [Solirubrobacterales bacterium]